MTGAPQDSTMVPRAASQPSPVAAAPAPASLPVRFQKPSYVIKDIGLDEAGMGGDEESYIPVGADISSTARPVSLRDIMKRLVSMKKMNVSWASDVDQNILVDVDIRSSDDFFQAIDNLLRQVDYFYELQGNTIVVRYKETRKFHIAMPFVASEYSMAAGGDVLGSAGEGTGTTVEGKVKLTSGASGASPKFDIWDTIKKNLDEVIGIWEGEKVVRSRVGDVDLDDGTTDDTRTQAEKDKLKSETIETTKVTSKGFYTIDRPIGLITVTAPRPIVEKVERYIENLKAELYRQVSIEAKIVEVELSNNSSTGIDWSGLLDQHAVGGSLSFGDAGTVYPGSGDFISRIVLTSPNSFELVLSAMNKQGNTKTLANPRLIVMNGQPAMLSIGENATYISRITTTSSDQGISTSAETSRVMSGIALGVVASIVDDNEIILNLTPVTSQLEGGEVPYETFGNALKVGLPVIKVREVNTSVRVKNGEMLVVGGLIDNTESGGNTKVPLLGDLPLVGKLFTSESVADTRKELVVLLKPTVL